MTLYYIAWFILALIVVIAEMNLMSFYLLAVAAGAIAGGISAYLDNSFQEQIIWAALATLVASCFCYYLRKRFKQMSDRHSNQLDVGQRVVVKADNIKEDGTAQVFYRGAQWDAYLPSAVLTPGIYFITKIDGAKLVLGEKLAEPSATAPSAAEPGATKPTACEATSPTAPEAAQPDQPKQTEQPNQPEQTAQAPAPKDEPK